MNLRKVGRWLGIFIGGLIAIAAASVLILLLKFRIPVGPVLEKNAQVRYQMIDLGQIEPDQSRYWLIEPMMRNYRIFLLDEEIPFAYLPIEAAKQCWPEAPVDMQQKGYTIEITLRVRKLRFASGYTPAKVLSIKPIPGVPHMSK